MELSPVEIRRFSGQAHPWQLASECLGLGEESGQCTAASAADIQYGCCTAPFDTHSRCTHLISGLSCVPSFIIFSIHAAVKKPILVDQIALYTC